MKYPYILHPFIRLYYPKHKYILMMKCIFNFFKIKNINEDQ